ncbi:hypothetical protein [Candidatus Chromulinivorax destructor]|uniref:Uncharacterized protein n=1 Tax=Candidatus Chromulinivorax destructor TaxID=2066483 RepID=A0A345ZBW4_9BACT|nr:hypothetical protein [Candidatus Chromulinivorax destructor]AXK60781.1 hypothetical protein C0J27_03470 [Candidatus Chromulinivorax destructor]
MRQVFLNKGAIALKEVCEPALNDHSMLVSVYHSLIIPETEKSIIASSEKESLLKNIPEKIRMIFNSISTKNIEGLTDFVKKVFMVKSNLLDIHVPEELLQLGKKLHNFGQGTMLLAQEMGLQIMLTSSAFQNHLP